MNLAKKIFLISGTTLILACTALAMKYNTKAACEEQTLEILFTHDIHSRLNEFPAMQNGQFVTVGGFARLSTAIREKRESNPDLLLLDAGDFSMGTLVQSIYSSDAAELRMLGNLGYDATTLGNHEFDYRSSGLADSLTSAMNSKDPLPQIVSCNIDWDTMEAEGLTKEQQLLKDTFDSFGIKDYTIITKKDLRIAIIGVFGKDSLACAPTCVLKFRDATEAVKETVSKINANEKVDAIICISHSGTNPSPQKSEDEILAQEVPEIDFIVSGHSHTVLDDYIQKGDTYIGSCGEYAQNIGHVILTKNENSRWSMSSYELIPINDSIQPDQATQDEIDYFMDIVDTSYLSLFGYTRDQVLAQNDILFSGISDLYYNHTEHNLGNILADSFQYSLNHHPLEDTTPVDITLVPAGCVRDTLPMGEITIENVFNTYSLGIGKDLISGYPLISVYLTGDELKLAAEIDATLSDLMPAARLYFSGMNFTYNPNRLPLNKVTDIYLMKDGQRIEIEDHKLYRIACDLYCGQMLGTVKKLSMGFIKISPKEADGTFIENIEDAIVYTDGRELKAWSSIAEYIGSFEDTDGDDIGNIPVTYRDLQGRKVIENDKSITSRFRRLNRFSIAILILCAVLLILFVVIICLLVRFIRFLARKIRNKRE